MSGFTIDIEFPHEMITDNDDVIGDERGIILSIDIPKVSMTAGIDNSWVELIGILRGNGESPEFGLVTEDASMSTLAPHSSLLWLQRWVVWPAPFHRACLPLPRGSQGKRGQR